MQSVPRRGLVHHPSRHHHVRCLSRKGSQVSIPKWHQSPRSNGTPDWLTPPEGSSWWVPRNYDPPGVGSRVRILAWGGTLGTVWGYEIHAGYLMVLVKPDQRPAWHLKQEPGRDICLFAGIEMEPERS